MFHKGFRDNPSILPRIKFLSDGQVCCMQFLTEHSLYLYASIMTNLQKPEGGGPKSVLKARK
jgi:hypothetical protein